MGKPTVPHVTVYALYDKPDDYPDKYIVRAWYVVDAVIIPEETAVSFDTEAEARSFLFSYTEIPLDPAEDPKIIGTWV